MFLILWRFRPAARYLAEFREAYGPGGVWHQLFRTSTEYVGLELLQPADPEGWWVMAEELVGQFELIESAG